LTSKRSEVHTQKLINKVSVCCVYCN